MEFPNYSIRSDRPLTRFRASLLLAFISMIATVLAFMFTCTVFCDYCYLRLSSRMAFSSVVEYQDIIANSKKIPNDWCKLQIWRVNWKDMIIPCEGKMSWEEREINSLHGTNANMSYIKMWELKSAGTLTLYSLNSNSHSSKQASCLT
jgi:hypothetical protein